jgi:hypothetical protein
VHLKAVDAGAPPPAGQQSAISDQQSATPAAGKTAPRAASHKDKDKKKAKSEPAPVLAGSRPVDSMAPRLRPAGAPPDRQQREREARKLKARLGDLEREIGEKERAVRDIENLMATPGFYDDRAAADKSVAERQRLLDEVAALMATWEELQTEAEARKA